MGVWFLSSFFGNYLSGFLGIFRERIDREAFFLMLTGLGFGAGVAIRVLGRPLERIVEGNSTASLERS
jgi:proton-dependent oligopeptide transporter, POT family